MADDRVHGEFDQAIQQLTNRFTNPIFAPEPADEYLDIADDAEFSDEEQFYEAAGDRGPSVLDIDSIYNPNFNHFGPQASAGTAASLAGFNDQCQCTGTPFLGTPVPPHLAFTLVMRVAPASASS